MARFVRICLVAAVGLAVAGAAYACDAEKASAEKASVESCSAKKATAEKASASSCSAKKATAEQASASSCSAKKASTEQASASSCSAKKASTEQASASSCASKKASATAASASSCSAKKTAATASASGCASKAAYANCQFDELVNELTANADKVTVTSTKTDDGIVMVFAATDKANIEKAQMIADHAYAMLAKPAACSTTRTKMAEKACDGCKAGLAAFADASISLEKNDMGATTQITPANEEQLVELEHFVASLRPADVAGE